MKCKYIKKATLECIIEHNFKQNNRWPVPDWYSTPCFVRISHFIVYKHDSFVGCTLCESQNSYMGFWLCFT